MSIREIELSLPNGESVLVACAGEGPIVLFVHGWAHTRSRWKPFQIRLSKTHSNTFASVDLPGFGSSCSLPIGRPYVSRYANFVREICNAIQETLNQPIQLVVAHSLGGLATCQAFQENDHGAKPNKIALMDVPLSGIRILKPLILFHPFIFLMISLRRCVPRFISSPMIKLLARLTVNSFRVIDSEFISDIMAVRTSVLTNSLFASTFHRALLTRPRIVSTIHVARGEDDWIATSNGLKPYIEAWNAELHTFFKSSHTPFMEVPEQFIAWIDCILKSNPEGPKSSLDESSVSYRMDCDHN